MRQFLSFFRQFLKPLANSNTCIFVNIAWKMNCGILKSKLILCEWNAFYFIEIAVIGFTLDEIKQCIVFFGTPGIYIYIKNCRRRRKIPMKKSRIVRIKSSSKHEYISNTCVNNFNFYKFQEN